MAKTLHKNDNSQDYYSGYEDWKGWDSFFTYTSQDREYFSGELKGIDLSGKNVLEIGFGSGSFLAWAKDSGANITGIEIGKKSCEAAKKAGVELLPADFENVAAMHTEQFDVIVAFDVFEHFTLNEIQMRIKAAAMMLRAGGFLILRFPNGQSPFGLAPQNADITHREALSKEKMEQICHGTSFKIIRYDGSYRVRGPIGIKRAARFFRYRVQDVIGALFNFAYPAQIPLAPVVVIVLQKPKVKRNSA